MSIWTVLAAYLVCAVWVLVLGFGPATNASELLVDVGTHVGGIVFSFESIVDTRKRVAHFRAMSQYISKTSSSLPKRISHFHPESLLPGDKLWVAFHAAVCASSSVITRLRPVEFQRGRYPKVIREILTDLCQTQSAILFAYVISSPPRFYFVRIVVV